MGVGSVLPTTLSIGSTKQLSRFSEHKWLVAFVTKIILNMTVVPMIRLFYSYPLFDAKDYSNVE